MKTIIVLLAVLFLAIPAYCADFYKDKATGEWKINFEKDESVILVIGKTKIRIHKCGQVDKQKWETVVPNPEQAERFYISNGTNSIITLPETDQALQIHPNWGVVR